MSVFNVVAGIVEQSLLRPVIKEKDMDAKEIAEQWAQGSDSFAAELLAKAYLDLLEQNRWIPVSERLPEEDKNVIVSGGLAYLEDGIWYSDTGQDYGRPIQWAVTHWKPLPNVPKDV